MLCSSEQARSAGRISNVVAVPCWLLLMVLCLWTPWAQAKGDQAAAAEVQPFQGGARSRDLPALTRGNITADQATSALKRYGIDDFGDFLYVARTPACALASLPPSSTGHLKVFCDTTSARQKCKSQDARKGAPPPLLYRMACQNNTCIETLPHAASACLLKAVFDVPAVKTVSANCKIDAPGAPVDDVTKPFTPEFLRTVGSSIDVEDCFIGAPPGAKLQAFLACRNGFFHVTTLIHMGALPLAPAGVNFQCVADTRCRSEEGCCEGDAAFGGFFICFAPRGAPRVGGAGGRGLERSAGRRVTASAALLLAGLLVGALAAWH